MSHILNSCKSYNTKSLNLAINSVFDETGVKPEHITSSFFLNIDGNSTNFDHFLVLLKGISHKFKAIGLAETNTGPNNSKPFQIPSYKQYYQHTREGKLKGTGVALYIHESLNVTLVNDVSECTTDIESLVYKVTNTVKPLYYGVVYRPNDGDIKTFYAKLQAIFDALPNEGVFIMGDYNINLLRDSPDSPFEESIFSSGFCPLISIATILNLTVRNPVLII